MVVAELDIAIQRNQEIEIQLQQQEGDAEDLYQTINSEEFVDGEAELVLMNMEEEQQFVENLNALLYTLHNDHDQLTRVIESLEDEQVRLYPSYLSGEPIFTLLIC